MNVVDRDTVPVFFRALSLNALFSGGCSLVMMLSPGSVSLWLGWGAPSVIMGIGLFLALFAVRLAVAAWRGRLPVVEARLVIGGDYAWVVGSVVLLSVFSGRFSPSGFVTVAAVALVVLGLAFFQQRSLAGPTPAGSLR